MKTFAAIAVAATLVVKTIAFSTEPCPADEINKLIKLGLAPGLTECQDTTGFNFVPPSGYPTDEQIFLMCGTGECRTTLAFLADLQPLDCQSNFLGVTMNVRNISDSFRPACTALGFDCAQQLSTAPPLSATFARLAKDAYKSETSTREREPASAITIDGRLDEAAWEEVPWSEDFVDIRGRRHWSQPWLATRVKLRFDDRFLYVGAYVEETAVWANVSARNDVVFADNDFEVFVDADGSAHNYKELEVNAINTTWNLWLDRPYRDGGHENSTRVDPAFGFDMVGKGLASAVFMKGTPNDPDQELHFWTVEIALPLKELARHTGAVVPPAPRSFWRINFSRVEWPVAVRRGSGSGGGGARFEKIPGQQEDNWVWSPQHAVDMHRPENWGYMQFRTRLDDAQDGGAVPLDPEWNVRYLAFQLYYAQHAFRAANGRFATRLAPLAAFFRSKRAFPCVDLRELRVDSSAGTFAATVAAAGDPAFLARIRDDSFITVRRATGAAVSVE
ncbi:hypothetical protein PybrP1_006950 [[Pythium] brassicae (nom. inval.)]|nr:hypothetical protein PybrP1_006950 [[Pythium] brassicae (nom. inval.)]